LSNKIPFSESCNSIPNFIAAKATFLAIFHFSSSGKSRQSTISLAFANKSSRKSSYKTTFQAREDIFQSIRSTNA
jgi:hypothetical protein